MLLHSTAISQDITQYLIGRAAARMCYQHAKKQAIQQITKSDARDFSSQCSKIVVDLYSLKSNSQKNLLGRQDKPGTPTCHKKKRQFQYTSSYVTPKTRSPPPGQRYSIKRMERLSTRPPLTTQNSYCLPLMIKQENDQNQQLLRQKKQKVSNLQTFFKRTQKQQKYKYKQQKMPKNPFTTDYNGDKLQIKKMLRTANTDTSFVIDVTARIREERQQNQRNTQLLTNKTLVRIEHMHLPKQNHKNPAFRKTAPLQYSKQSELTPSQTSARKFQKQSLKLQHLTLKDFQKELNSQQKNQKSRFNKCRLNTTNISLGDCIRMI